MDTGSKVYVLTKTYYHLYSITSNAVFKTVTLPYNLVNSFHKFCICPCGYLLYVHFTGCLFAMYSKENSYTFWFLQAKIYKLYLY